MNEEKTINKTALVLEGGGMRGIYTAGVIDFFLDRLIYFEYVIGVSAGATHALSYISRQRGRARRVNVDYCRRPDYMGPLCLLREGSLFGMDLLFRKIPFELDPFDFDTFQKNANRYTAVVSNIKTGKAEYLSPRGPAEILTVAQATCSLPLISRPVVIGGIPYLDGGICDSIPVRKVEADGFGKMVIILTQPAGYRKSPGKKMGAARFLYRKFPALVKALETRNDVYNETLDYIETLEASGTAFVIRPEPQPGLDRLERDPDLLNGLYRSGYADAEKNCGRLEEFIRE